MALRKMLGSADHTAGEDADAAIHDALATQELERLVASLTAASVPEESCPVKVNWGC